MAGSVLNSDGTFPDGQRSDVMRNSLENKNLLSKKGSIYIGTGTNHAVGNSEINVANTSVLNPPEVSDVISDDYIIVTNHSATNGLEYKALSGIIVGNSNKIYATSDVTNVSSGYKNVTITNALPPNASYDTIYYIVEA
jgi:hypothetical protein